MARNLLLKQRDNGLRRRALVDRIIALTTGADLVAWDVADHVVERDSALAAIARLPDGDLELLSLVMWHGLAPREAAQVVGCSTATFFVRLHRAPPPHQSDRQRAHAPYPPSRLPRRRPGEPMSSGVPMKQRNADDMFRTLRPADLDTLVAEAHARRRDRDLAAAWDGADPAVLARTMRRRMPRLLVATLAAGAVAAAAAGVIVATDGSGGHGRPAPVQTMDARSVLLASADSAAKAPATTGAYWYVRERETSFLSPVSLSAAQKRGIAKKLPKGAPARKLQSPPLSAYVSQTEDSWSGRDRHDRTITGIDRAIRFASPADKAKWQRLSAGAKRRWGLDESEKPQVGNYDFSKVKLSVTQRDKTVDALMRLPADPAALDRTLRVWFGHENRSAERHDGEPSGGDFTQYVFGEAQDLLAGPLTPGARAALYRVLAGQPGIHSLGPATDALGRRGVTLTAGSAAEARDGSEIRLIVDPSTGGFSPRSPDAAGRPI